MDDNFLNPSVPSPSPDITELNKRRSIIKSLYQEVLGRDADINGLSYYTVHKEISEDEIRKQMSQSTDHKDLLIRAQKYPEIEKKCIELEDQVIRLQNSNNQKDSLIENLRAVTSNMRQQSPQGQGNPSEYAHDLMTNPNNPNYQNDRGQNNNSPINVKNLQFPKTNKGCLGIIKNILGI